MRTPLVLLVLLALSSPFAAARAADAPGVHRMKLGDVEIVALRDAAGPRPLDKLIANPEEIPKAGVAKPDDPVMLQVNTFLVVSGASLTLIDSGNGGEAGQTLANLKAAGYRPEQVTAVLLTHLHGDHVGGMLADGKPTFPNARIYLERREAAFWIDPEGEKTAPDPRRNGMRRARENLAPYDAAGRLIRFDGAGTPISGVAAIPAYGHTPGHTAFLVESRGSRLLVWGDVVHLQQLQFPNPNVSLVFDVDADAARETRKAILAKAAAEGYAVAGMHMAWPGIGRVRKAATGYAWEPIP